MRNDRFPCHLGCRQPRVKQKGKLAGVGVDSNECSLLIMHFRGTGSWLLFMASANAKVTVTRSLIRRRSPPPPPSCPCRKVCGKHHPLPKIPTECSAQGAAGEMPFSCLLFPLWCRNVSAQAQKNLSLRVRFAGVWVSFPHSSHFAQRNHNDAIHPPHDFSASWHTPFKSQGND